LVDELIPLVPVLQFVVTFLPPLRLWLARSTTLATTVCSKVIAALKKHLQRESDTSDALASYVVFLQCFGSVGNLNGHLHITALDESRRTKGEGRLSSLSGACQRRRAISLFKRKRMVLSPTRVTHSSEMADLAMYFASRSSRSRSCA
jgi:hypothetical protein